MLRLCNDSSPIFLARVNHVTVLILFHVIVKYLLVTVKIMKKKKNYLGDLKDAALPASSHYVMLFLSILLREVTHVKDIQSR